MKFYGRTVELEELRKVREISQKFARFTVLTGRRRVGKTQLVRRAFDDGKTPYVHLVITRKPEKIQCASLQSEVERVLGLNIPYTTQRFVQLFEILMKYSCTTAFTLVLDEFQEFDNVDAGVFGEVAAIWDKYHNESKMNLVVCGSVNRLMFKIFYDDSEPLYGRNTGSLHLTPFPVSVLKEIFADFCPNYRNEDLLALWTITGGVARYVELLMENGSFTEQAMLNTVFGGITTFLDEGKAILSEEFGKEYGTYFEILSLIASGHTTYAELKNELDMEIGGYLTKLEKYSLISKRQPIFETSRTKNCVYQVDDSFFSFWFRFVYRHQALLELHRLDAMRELCARDFATFSGKSLERYFRWKFIEEKKYTQIGAWWDRKGENEIDLVCEDELGGTLDFFEVKREKSRIDLNKLQEKLVAFFAKNPTLKSREGRIAGLSMNDM